MLSTIYIRYIFLDVSQQIITLTDGMSRPIETCTAANYILDRSWTTFYWNFDPTEHNLCHDILNSLKQANFDPVPLNHSALWCGNLFTICCRIINAVCCLKYFAVLFPLSKSSTSVRVLWAALRSHFSCSDRPPKLPTWNSLFEVSLIDLCVNSEYLTRYTVLLIWIDIWNAISWCLQIRTDVNSNF